MAWDCPSDVRSHLSEGLTNEIFYFVRFPVLCSALRSDESCSFADSPTDVWQGEISMFSQYCFAVEPIGRRSCIAYEVLRPSRMKFIFLEAHCSRLGSSSHAVLSAQRLWNSQSGRCSSPLSDSSVCSRSNGEKIEKTAARAAIYFRSIAPSVNKNAKILLWLGRRNGGLVDAHSQLSHSTEWWWHMAVFYIESYYPPSSWYGSAGENVLDTDAGVVTRTPEGEALSATSAPRKSEEVGKQRCNATVGVLFDASRVEPTAKTVQQSQLRERAEELRRTLGVFEVLLLHEDGSPPTLEGLSDAQLLEQQIVVEGSRSNLILVQGNTMLSSLPDTILMGCTLAAILQPFYNAENRMVQGVTLVERRLTLKDLVSCDAALLSGTSIGVLPIGAVHFAFRRSENIVASSLPFLLLELSIPQRAHHVSRCQAINNYVGGLLKEDSETGNKHLFLRKSSSSNAVYRLLRAIFDEALRSETQGSYKHIVNI